MKLSGCKLLFGTFLWCLFLAEPSHAIIDRYFYNGNGCHFTCSGGTSSNNCPSGYSFGDTPPNSSGGGCTSCCMGSAANGTACLNDATAGCGGAIGTVDFDHLILEIDSVKTSDINNNVNGGSLDLKNIHWDGGCAYGCNSGPTQGTGCASGFHSSAYGSGCVSDGNTTPQQCDAAATSSCGAGNFSITYDDYTLTELIPNDYVVQSVTDPQGNVYEGKAALEYLAKRFPYKAPSED